MVAPRPAAKGHCSAAGPVVLIPKLGLHRIPRCAAHSRCIDATKSLASRRTGATRTGRLAFARRLYEGELPEAALQAFAEWTA